MQLYTARLWISFYDYVRKDRLKGEEYTIDTTARRAIQVECGPAAALFQSFLAIRLEKENLNER
jgi:hypothetical protein